MSKNKLQKLSSVIIAISVFFGTIEIIYWIANFDILNLLVSLIFLIAEYQLFYRAYYVLMMNDFYQKDNYDAIQKHAYSMMESRDSLKKRTAKRWGFLYICRKVFDFNLDYDSCKEDIELYRKFLSTRKENCAEYISKIDELEKYLQGNLDENEANNLKSIYYKKTKKARAHVNLSDFANHVRYYCFNLLGICIFVIAIICNINMMKNYGYKDTPEEAMKWFNVDTGELEKIYTYEKDNKYEVIYSDGEKIVYTVFYCKTFGENTRYKAKSFLVEFDDSNKAAIALDSDYLTASSIISPPSQFYDFSCSEFPKIIITNVSTIDDEYQTYYKYEFVKEIEVNGNTFYMWEVEKQ